MVKCFWETTIYIVYSTSTQAKRWFFSVASCHPWVWSSHTHKPFSCCFLLAVACCCLLLPTAAFYCLLHAACYLLAASCFLAAGCWLFAMLLLLAAAADELLLLLLLLWCCCWWADELGQYVEQAVAIVFHKKHLPFLVLPWKFPAEETKYYDQQKHETWTYVERAVAMVFHKKNLVC